jgi:type I restriction enzyme S subunit
MWPKYPLEDVLELIIDHRGKTPKKLAAEFVSCGVQVISAQNITANRLDLGATSRFVDAEIADRWMPTPLQPGDVLLSSEAPLGCVAVVTAADGRLCLGQRVFALRPRSGRLNAGYLAAALKVDPTRAGLLARASGTTAQGIKQAELRKVLLPVPPLADQRAIASVLELLDGKMESNRRLTKLTHKVAVEEFNRLFGGDWPGSKAAGRAPKRGVWGRIGDVLELRYGKALRASDRVAGSVAVVGSSGVIGTHNTSLICGPVAVVGRKGAAGSVSWVDNDAWPIDTTFFALPKDGRPMTWAYGALLAARLADAAGDSAVPGLNRDVALGRPAVVVGVDDALIFDSLAAPLLRAAAQSRVEAQTLEAIRDALIPRLVSGRIRVPMSNDPQEGLGAAVTVLERAAR